MKVPETELFAGKYQLGRLVGSGGMGTVHEATHVVLGMPVAIKRLLPEALRAPGAKERFFREARAASQLPSDVAPKILDFGTVDDGVPYLIMERLHGVDLGTWIEKMGPMAVTDAVRHVADAATAMAIAHDLGIVHRDLKPSNLFLDTSVSPRVKVLDFGISKQGGRDDARLTTARAMLGTAPFMSPEQVRGDADVDAQADVWALGATLYALLAGVAPFQGEGVADLAAKILRDPPTPLRTIRPDVPEAVDAIVQRCLAKERQVRIGSARELASALRAVLPDLVPEAKRDQTVGISMFADTAAGTGPGTPPPVAVSASVSRPRWAHVSMGLSAVVALSALAWKFSPRHERSVEAPVHPREVTVAAPENPELPALASAIPTAPPAAASRPPSLRVAAKAEGPKLKASPAPSDRPVEPLPTPGLFDGRE